MSTTALVTGASAGLGTEFAWLFAADGHDLVLVARRADKLEALATAIKAKHKVTVTVMTEDLAVPGAAKRLADKLASSGIAIEFLVNNAGLGAVGAFADQELARSMELLQVNVTALVELTRLLLPSMIARKSGRILNIGSTAGFVPGPFMAMYYASKAFVNSFTEALSVELEGTGVTATVSCPGATATEFAQVAGSDKTALFAAKVMGAREVAEDGYRAMLRGRVIAVVGAMNKLKMFGIRFAPRGLARKAAADLNRA